MKKTKKLVPQVLLRRMILVLLDAAIVIFSFYFALLLRADGAVEASWWPHNRALLYQNLPWIVALYLLRYQAGGLYHVLWKYAGERDLIRLGGMIAVPGASVQKAQGIKDAPENLAADMTRIGKGLGDPAHIDFLCKDASDTFEWTK